MTQHASTILMTGATGFLGQFLLRDLLLRGRRIVAILRAPPASAAERLAGMMQRLGFDVGPYVASGQLLLEHGSLPDELPPPRWGRTDEILSCAASLQLFSNGNGEPFRTNALGAEALIEWAKAHGVGRLHAVSTAYVCGCYKDRIGEVFHLRPPDFQTEYEFSKWLAEDHFARWGREPGHVLTILRPSFLIGDSRTGYTCQFGGFYQFARLVSLLRDQHADGGNGHGTFIPLRIPGREHDPIQNLVPIDFAARMVTEVVCNPSLQGRIYHLTDPRPPTWTDFKQWLEEYFNIYGGRFVDCDELSADRTPAESLLWEKYDLLMPRIHHHIRFDQANSLDVMRRLGITFPSLTRQRMFTLLDYAASQNWGARSKPGANGANGRAAAGRR